MFEADLAESRGLLDDTSKEEALLKLENNKLNGIIVDLREKLEHEKTSNKWMQDKLNEVEDNLNEKENLLADSTIEKLELQNRVQYLEAQLDELGGKLEKEKEQLENDINAFKNTENTYESIEGEAQYMTQVQQNEISYVDIQTDVFNNNIDASDDYDGKLQELREELEGEFQRQLGERDENQKVLQKMYDDLEAEYQLLLGDKISLDMTAHNKSLKGEIQTLNIETHDSNSESTERRGSEECSELYDDIPAIGDHGRLEILDENKFEKFVTIISNGTDVGELCVQGATDSNIEVPANRVLPSSQWVTIFSESHGLAGNPPSEFVLEGDCIDDGKYVETPIFNTNSEIIAIYTVSVNGEHPRAQRRIQKRPQACVVM